MNLFYFLIGWTIAYFTFFNRHKLYNAFSRIYDWLYYKDLTAQEKEKEKKIHDLHPEVIYWKPGDIMTNPMRGTPQAVGFVQAIFVGFMDEGESMVLCDKVPLHFRDRVDEFDEWVEKKKNKLFTVDPMDEEGRLVWYNRTYEERVEKEKEKELLEQVQDSYYQQFLNEVRDIQRHRN